MANRELTPWGRGSSLTPFGGRDPFSSFRREMDRLFDDFFAPAEPRSFGAAAPAAGTAGGLAMVSPDLDVEETEQAYIVTAELPGMDPKDVELKLKDNALVLSGEKRSERHEEGAGRRWAERSFGRFERVIPFQADIDAERVEASSRNGVLTITLPKHPQAREASRRIEIKPEAGIKGGAGAQTGAQAGAETGAQTGAQRGVQAGQTTGEGGASAATGATGATGQ